jgi:hypothetical protein
MRMKKLFLRIILLLTPLLLVGGYFIAFDPMKIIHQTTNPVSPGVLMNDRLYQARYLLNTKKKYNSFIFGSSRSKAFKTKEWIKFLPTDAIPYHMGVNDESIYGIARKIAFLDKQGFALKNILIQMDPRLLSLTTNSEAHVFRDYYTLTDESAASYYQRFFTAFLNVNFLRNYLNYACNDTILNKNQNVFLWDPGFSFKEVTGDIFYTRNDSELKADSLSYYKVRKLETYDRTPIIHEIQITGNGKDEMDNIKRILDKHRAKVLVVISPNFDRIQLNPTDLWYLKKSFGMKRIFDFSGQNKWTENVGDYYENKHFKPYVANKILQEVYK